MPLSDQHKRILSGLVMGALVVGLIALGWMAYQERQNPPGMEEIPYIRADKTPFKITPENPGGMEIPHTDKMIYNAVTGGKNAAPTSAPTVSAPEEPISKETLSTSAQKKVIKLEDVPISATNIKEKPAPTAEYYVQLGSYRSKDNLESGWKTLKQRFPSLLKDLTYRSKAVDLGNNKIFHRLHVGSFASKEEAQALCKTLTTKKQGCILVKP